MIIERLAIYGSLGLVMNAWDSACWSTPEFWCVVALFVVSEYLAHQDGVAEGIWLTANLPIEQLLDIQQQIRDLEDNE